MSDDSLNIEALVEENSAALGIPKEIYLKILTTSMVECATDIDALEKALIDNDYPSIQPLAHKLKGVLFNIKLDSIAVPAQEIDKIAKEQGSIDSIKEQFATLKSSFQALKNSFV